MAGETDGELSFYEYDARRDPRLAGLEPGRVREFTPPPERAPKPFESRFLELRVETGRMMDPEWVNRPSDWSRWGTGKGYPALVDMPSFTYPVRRGLVPMPDLWSFAGALLMSERMIEVIVRFDPAGLFHTPVAFRFADDLEPECPYRLVDFVRVYDGIDHARSVLRYQRWSEELEAFSFARERIGKRNYAVVRPFALMPNIPADIHVFRPRGTDDLRGMAPVFSRELIEALVERDLCCFSFSDPAIGGSQHHGARVTLGEASDWDFRQETWDAYYH